MHTLWYLTRFPLNHFYAFLFHVLVIYVIVCTHLCTQMVITSFKNFLFGRIILKKEKEKLLHCTLCAGKGKFVFGELENKFKGELHV